MIPNFTSFSPWLVSPVALTLWQPIMIEQNWSLNSQEGKEKRRGIFPMTLGMPTWPTSYSSTWRLSVLVSLSVGHKLESPGKSPQMRNCSHQICLLACLLASFPLSGMISLLLTKPIGQLLVTAKILVPLLHDYGYFAMPVKSWESHVWVKCWVNVWCQRGHGHVKDPTALGPEIAKPSSGGWVLVLTMCA